MRSAHPEASKGRRLSTALLQTILILTVVLLFGWLAKSLIRPLKAPEPPLTAAAERGDINEVTKLLHDGVDPDTKNEDGSTALYTALVTGHFDVAEALFAAGASVNVITANRTTYLKRAQWEIEAGFGDSKHQARMEKVIKWLLDHGAK